MEAQEILSKLSALVERLATVPAASGQGNTGQVAAPGQQPPQAQCTSFGLPQPMAVYQPQSFGVTLQPTGASVPVTVPMPDGRELSIRVHFGPEAVQNLQGLAAQAAAMFGSYLQARSAYRGYGNSGYPRRR